MVRCVLFEKSFLITTLLLILADIEIDVYRFVFVGADPINLSTFAVFLFA